MMSNALEEKQLNTNNTSSVLKWTAVFISYIFHPVFIPVYAVWFLVYIHPSYFSGFSAAAKKYTILIVIYNLVFFPLLSVLLLKAVGFIQSVFLKTQKLQNLHLLETVEILLLLILLPKRPYSLTILLV